jgi:hypothetical protein
MERFLLHHVHDLADGHEDVKLIGVFSSRDKAQAVLNDLRGQPGFRDVPDGFEINSQILDQAAWLEGYVTVQTDETSRTAEE